MAATPLVIAGGGTGTPVGDQILTAFTSATQAASTQVQDSVNAASANPGDPTNMINMQVALSNYSLALTVQSSVVKSLEETAKSITQKL